MSDEALARDEKRSGNDLSWSIRDLRAHRTTAFLTQQTHSVQPIRNAREGAAGYLAGEAVFQDIYEEATRAHAALIERIAFASDPCLDEAELRRVKAAFGEALREVLEGKGVVVDEAPGERTPRTAHGELDLVAPGRRAGLAAQAAPPRLNRGRAPVLRASDRKREAGAAMGAP